jgi:two-component system, OmpR family, phosphate regulon response regulator PhoB
MPVLTGSDIVVIAPRAGSAIVGALELDGHRVRQGATGAEAFDLLHRSPDLLILDLVLPVISGIEVLAHVRQRSATPVLVLTELSSDATVVRALDLGADDVVSLPADPGVVAARVRALLRRSGQSAARQRIVHGHLTVDLDSRDVIVAGRHVELTAREFDLLAYLVQSPGTVFTRDRLLHAVWQSSKEWQQEGTVTEHIRRLREKIEREPARPDWLVTVRGVGYRFERRHPLGRSTPVADPDPQGVERLIDARDEVVLGDPAEADRLVEAAHRR